MATSHKTMRKRALSGFLARLADQTDGTFECVVETGHVSAWVEHVPYGSSHGVVKDFMLAPGFHPEGVYIPINLPGTVSGERDLVVAHIAGVVREKAPMIWDAETGVELPQATITREELIAAGELLFGEDWKNPLARALGPFHPDGARARIDDRLVRRWASGERQVPPWVRSACIRLCLRRKDSIVTWLDEVFEPCEGHLYSPTPARR